jgi:hypothetical protein
LRDKKQGLFARLTAAAVGGSLLADCGLNSRAIMNIPTRLPAAFAVVRDGDALPPRLARGFVAIGNFARKE